MAGSFVTFRQADLGREFASLAAALAIFLLAVMTIVGLRSRPKALERARRQAITDTAYFLRLKTIQNLICELAESEKSQRLQQRTTKRFRVVKVILEEGKPTAILNAGSHTGVEVGTPFVIFDLTTDATGATIERQVAIIRVKSLQISNDLSHAQFLHFSDEYRSTIVRAAGGQGEFPHNRALPYVHFGLNQIPISALGALRRNLGRISQSLAESQSV